MHGNKTMTRRRLIAASAAVLGIPRLAGAGVTGAGTGGVAAGLAAAKGIASKPVAMAAPMRAIVIERAGKPVAGNVRLVSDWPAPVARAGEVVVRTLAAALNHLDLWVGAEPTRTPWVSGSDACGTVESVGEGVDASWIGRRVIFNAAVPMPESPRPGPRPARPPRIDLIGSETPGCMAEKFTVPADNLLEVGEADPIEAAAFALTHITAWRMIVSWARVTPEDACLVTGIGGGVALAALGILNTIGCEVIVTSRHQAKLDRAKRLGARHGVLDEGQDWSKQVLEITAKRGVDVCVDSVGAPLHLRCVQSLAQGGRLAICGASAGSESRTDLSAIYWNQQSVLGSSMGSMDEFREVTALFRRGVLRPVVDSVHEAKDAAAAYARLEAAAQFGKVVVRWAS